LIVLIFPRRRSDSAERSPHPEPNELFPLSRRIFVNNFPSPSRTDRLRELFAQAGEISTFRILTTRTGTFRGQAIIQFRTIHVAEDAIRRFNDYEFNDHKLNVEYFRQSEEPLPARRRSLTRRQSPPPMQYHKIPTITTIPRRVQT
jgi:RNA recognition motif-containing protein